MIIVINDSGINLNELRYFKVRTTYHDEDGNERYEVYFDLGRSACTVDMSNEQLCEFMNQHFIKVL